MATTIAVASRERPWLGEEATRDARISRRVMIVWALLFFNILGSPSGGGLLPIHHREAQLCTQGALLLALVLVLTINPRGIIRRSWFLGLYTVLGVLSLMMSVRLVGLGTAYRGFRLLAFLLVLWLLTPWWRDRGLVLLRAHLLCLVAIVATLAAGIVLAPHKAFVRAASSSGRLTDVFWPMPSTQVGHYMATLTGVLIILWMSGKVRWRPAVFWSCLGFVALIESHTRTALGGLVLGLLVAGMSLLFVRRRARRAFAVVLLLMMVAGAFTPQIKSWLFRGESASLVQSLSGRTKVWPLVLSENRPETNRILGSGITKDGLIDQAPAVNGLSIDSSWYSTYQNQGIVGVILDGVMFALLLLAACLRPRGPTTAVSLFLIVYCLVASYTETGMGLPSSYLMDLTLAASLLLPRSLFDSETDLRLAEH